MPLPNPFRLLPWQIEIIQAAEKLSPDERLVVLMPRQHTHPIWEVLK
jgi:hypothetical protein